MPGFQSTIKLPFGHKDLWNELFTASHPLGTAMGTRCTLDDLAAAVLDGTEDMSPRVANGKGTRKVDMGDGSSLEYSIVECQSPTNVTFELIKQTGGQFSYRGRDGEPPRFTFTFTPKRDSANACIGTVITVDSDVRAVNPAALIHWISDDTVTVKQNFESSMEGWASTMRQRGYEPLEDLSMAEKPSQSPKAGVVTRAAVKRSESFSARRRARAAAAKPIADEAAAAQHAIVQGVPTLKLGTTRQPGSTSKRSTGSDTDRTCSSSRSEAAEDEMSC